MDTDLDTSFFILESTLGDTISPANYKVALAVLTTESIAKNSFNNCLTEKQLEYWFQIALLHVTNVGDVESFEEFYTEYLENMYMNRQLSEDDLNNLSAFTFVEVYSYIAHIISKSIAKSGFGKYVSINTCDIPKEMLQIRNLYIVADTEVVDEHDFYTIKMILKTFTHV